MGIELRHVQENERERLMCSVGGKPTEVKVKNLVAWIAGRRERIADGRVLRLIEAMLKAGSYGRGRLYPRGKSIQRFMDQVRERTKRRVPLRTTELIANLNPVVRGWGNYYKRAHVRTLFNRLNGWIVNRIRSHRCKRWRNGGWRQLPRTKLHGEYGLVSLVQLIPSIASRKHESS